MFSRWITRTAVVVAVLALGSLTAATAAWAEAPTTVCVPEAASKSVLSTNAKGECPTKTVNKVAVKYKTEPLPGKAELEKLVKLLPHDDDAQRLAKQAFHFPDFFAHFDIEPPKLDGRALAWGHCHHKATGGMEGELGLLRAMGLEVETVQAGCCGLAGSWGFEEGHHELSMKIAEGARRRVPNGRRGRRLLVQDADRRGIRSEGASCRRGHAPGARARARRPWVGPAC